MCGIFGYVAIPGQKIDLARLEQIAEITESRGRDAFGFAWVDSRGRLHSFRRCGRISDHLALLTMAADARMLIGHCRLATHGAPDHNVNNHPHRADRGYFVHNGVVRNYLDLIRRHRLPMSSECDSEVIGLLIEQAHGSITNRCIDAVNAVSAWSPLAMLGLWTRPRTLVAIRRGNPLHLARGRDGYWLASLAHGLPGRPAAIDNAAGIEFQFAPSGSPILTPIHVDDSDSEPHDGACLGVDGPPLFVERERQRQIHRLPFEVERD